jgi:general secretion pathway protein J
MTLVEVLVALAIFGILSMMAYGGLNAILRADEATREQAQALSRLQRAVNLVGSDLEQALARQVRGGYGDRLPAMEGVEPDWLEWTRGGWRNPAGHARSDLQRVAYVVRGGALERLSWEMLDRVQDSEPRREVLLEEVEGMGYRFFDQQGLWREVWPPDRQPESMGTLPRAVEVTLTTRRWGEVRRLVVLQ